MSDVAKAGVNQLIDVVDVTTDKAIDAIQGLKGIIASGAVEAVDFSNDTIDNLVDRIQKLKTELLNELREASNIVTEPLP